MKRKTITCICGLPPLVLACASQQTPPSASPNTTHSSSEVGVQTSDPIDALTAEDKDVVVRVEQISRASDDARRMMLSKRLLKLGLEVRNSAWVEARRNVLARANAAARISPTQKQFEAQLAAWQTETLDRVISAMHYAVAAAVWPFALAIASNKAEPLPRRTAALGLLDRLVPPSQVDFDARESARSAVSQTEHAMLSDPHENRLLVISSMRNGFRQCYNAQLAREPAGDVHGNVAFEIDPTGSVGSVSVAGLFPEMSACIESVVGAAQFLPTNAEKPIVVHLPLQFVKQ